jgi:hypothetical protein
VDVVLIAEDDVCAQLVSARFQYQARSGAFLLEMAAMLCPAKSEGTLRGRTKRKKLSTGG